MYTFLASAEEVLLEEWLTPQLRHRGLMEDVCLQHDRAPAHFTSRNVRDILNEHYLGRWIDRGSPIFPLPLSRPQHSPEFAALDNSLWGIIKGQVVAHLYRNNDELYRAVQQALTTITP
jgi:hypothetical protein